MEKPLPISEELKKLADLKEKGVLTDEEFQREKEKLLGGRNNGATESNESEKPKDAAQPAIVIQQSTTNMNQATAAAVAVNKNGCLGTVLKAIGAVVVLLFILGFCAASGGKDKAKEAVVKQEVEKLEAAAKTAGQTLTQEEEFRRELLDKDLVESAKKWAVQKEDEFKKSDAVLSKVWRDMNPDVRNHLKKSQISWNREKEAVCNKESESGANETQAQGLKFECLTTWTNNRIPELISAEKEMLPRVFAAQKAGLEKTLNAELARLKKIGQAIPQEVANTLSKGGDIDDWVESVEQKCSREEAAQVDKQQSEIDLMNCLISEVRVKNKELEGYTIQ